MVFLVEDSSTEERRWIEGRALPYRRHRWDLSALLRTAETDLWPELRSSQPRPEEIVAVYPHLSTVPYQAWQSLFRSAEHDISILDVGRWPLGSGPALITDLAGRARAGVIIRICLAEADAADTSAGRKRDLNMPAPDAREALKQYAPLLDRSEVQIRLDRGVLYNFIYRADGQLFIVQHVYGVPIAQAPLLHLQRRESGDLFTAYLESFERIWADADARY